MVFVPEGRAIVARRFIAGLAIHRICVPEGRLKFDLGRRGRRMGVWAYGRAGLGVVRAHQEKIKKFYAIGATRRYADTPIPQYVFPGPRRQIAVFV
jgi:hypothetical protein